ncbi:hypothetical protein H4582DRAFT_2022136 [Lactarius indigo]|nr:hypothetical protein H4582DRAFT_2022136 [Lactarius indigo]
MLTGLLRWENARQKGGIWWLLYTQGLAWMIIVAAAEAPIVVFILLNLNDPMNLVRDEGNIANDGLTDQIS